MTSEEIVVKLERQLWHQYTHADACICRILPAFPHGVVVDERCASLTTGPRAAEIIVNIPQEQAPEPAVDMVNAPPHYRAHPSGVECIIVAEHFGFLLGNTIKYIWRAGSKGGPEQELEDLKKASYYLNRRIHNLEQQ